MSAEYIIKEIFDNFGSKISATTVTEIRSKLDFKWRTEKSVYFDK